MSLFLSTIIIINNNNAKSFWHVPKQTISCSSYLILSYYSYHPSKFNKSRSINKEKDKTDTSDKLLLVNQISGSALNISGSLFKLLKATISFLYVGKDAPFINTKKNVNSFKLFNSVKAYLLQGRTQSPQHFSMPLKFFSASRMSALIWSMPSSIRSSCSN